MMRSEMEGFLKYGIVRVLVLATVFFMVSAGTFGQIVSARAVLDTSQALIGDQLNLHLILEKPEDVAVAFPEIKEKLSDDIVVVSKSEIDTSFLPDGLEQLEQKLTIAAFDTGLVKVPPFAFRFQTEQLSDTIETLPAFISIIPLQLDKDIRDIKSNYLAPVTLIELVPYFLALVVVILLFWLIRKYYLKKYGNIQMEMANPGLDPPDITAMRELEKLRKEAPWLHHNIKHYYVRLSEVLRNYVEQQFHMPALEQTTNEIILSLGHLNIDTETLHMLEQLLALADLVKFAKVVPGQQENAMQIDLAIEYVKRSSPVKGDSDPGNNEQKPETVMETA